MKKFTCVLCILSGVLLFVGGFCLLRLLPEPEGIVKTLPYLMIGIGCGLFGHGVGDLVNRWAIQKDPALAKQVEIDAKDERNVMISNAAKAKGFDMTTYVFAALMLAYALMGASFPIVIPFVIAYLFVQFYALYRRFQLEKVL